MNNKLEIDQSKFLKFGITKEQLYNYSIICFPENIEAASEPQDLYDASDAIMLSKYLKLAKINCANSLDLGLVIQIFERRSNEKWFGMIYIRDAMAIPFLVGFFASLAANQVPSSEQKAEVEEPTPKVHLELKIEKKDNITSIKYDGDAETLVTILENIDIDNEKAE